MGELSHVENGKDRKVELKMERWKGCGLRLPRGKAAKDQGLRMKLLKEMKLETEKEE